MPGFLVAALRMFQSVVNGTPDRWAKSCTCACFKATKAARTSSGVGMFDFISGPDPTGFSTIAQPDSVDSYKYCPAMAKTNSSGVLWRNVQALMAVRYGKENLTQFRIDAKIGASAATGIKTEGLSVGIGVLDKIAKEFKVSTWQLLAEELGANLHTLEGKQMVPVYTPPKRALRLAASSPSDAPASSPTDDEVRAARATRNKNERHKN